MHFSRTFREAHDHWIAARLGVRRPVGHCIGQMLATPLPVAGEEPADTLFLMYGRLPHGAVC